MTPFPKGALTRTVACSLGALILLSGCSGADDDDESGETTAPVGVDVRDVVCPGAVPAVSSPLSGPDEIADFEAYLLDPEEDQGEDYAGTYCLQVNVLEKLDSAPTELTLEAEKDAENYGESYTTRDPDGTEEIANFPFSIGVYGECRPVSATLRLTNGEVYSAQMRIGTGCPGT